MEAFDRGGHRPERSPAHVEIPWPRNLAKMERLPPPKPRRDEDALREALGAEPHGTRLRSLGCRNPSPSRRAQRLHRARHTCHGAHGISVPGERGGTGFTFFARQSRLKAERCCGAVIAQVSPSTALFSFEVIRPPRHAIIHSSVICRLNPDSERPPEGSVRELRPRFAQHGDRQSCHGTARAPVRPNKRPRVSPRESPRSQLSA